MHIYIHIPFCVRKCRYCAFYSIGYDSGIAKEFVNSLFREIEMMAIILRNRNNFYDNDTLNTLYIGGGTPSILEPALIGEIVRAIQQNFGIDKFDEFTIEANPESVSRQKVDRYIEFSANRMSIGVQSLDDRQLKFLGRIHNSEQALDAIKSARAAGIRNISLDFIYGSPNFDVKSFLPTLERTIAFGIEHISLYSLTVEPNTPLENDVRKHLIVLPTTDEVGEQYYAIAEYLDSQGFAEYEVSNFAKAKHRCKHNLAYWHRQKYLGLGPSAHSFDGEYRWANTKSVERYISAFSRKYIPLNNKIFGDDFAKMLADLKLPIDFIEKLTPVQEISEIVMLGLRLDEGFYIEKLGDYAEKIIEAAKELLVHKILTFDGEKIWLNRKQKLLADGVAAKILRQVN
ncbi:radical SAM family heme chaperone HemW [bacterium]|nr:radical SAM family heme chaperone HemW [bacterium]